MKALKIFRVTMVARPRIEKCTMRRSFVDFTAVRIAFVRASGIVASHAKPMARNSGPKLGPQARMGVASIVLMALEVD